MIEIQGPQGTASWVISTHPHWIGDEEMIMVGKAVEKEIYQQLTKEGLYEKSSDVARLHYRTLLAALRKRSIVIVRATEPPAHYVPERRMTEASKS